MSQRLFVATRKGLFSLTAKRGNVGSGRSPEPPSWALPVSMVLPDTRDRTLYAALNLGHFGAKLHRSPDRGKTWEECAVPAFPKSEAPEVGEGIDPEAGLVPGSGGKDEAGTLWAGTIPGGLFRSTDRGDTWELNQALWNLPERGKWMGGGYDESGVHSICVDPRNPRHLTVGISIGGVWHSEDGGESWKVRTRGMFAEYMPPDRREDPVMQDPHRIVQNEADPDVLWCQHHNGVFRSADRGRTWETITVKPSVFGFAAASHPRDPKTAWLVPAIKDECRVPVGGKMVAVRTRNEGKSFKTLRTGLPQKRAYDLVYRHGLDVGTEGKMLALGSTTGSLWISEDSGDSWKTFSANLPPVYCVRFEK